MLLCVCGSFLVRSVALVNDIPPIPCTNTPGFGTVARMLNLLLTVEAGAGADDALFVPGETVLCTTGLVTQVRRHPI